MEGGVRGAWTRWARIEEARSSGLAWSAGAGEHGGDGDGMWEEVLEVGDDEWAPPVGGRGDGCYSWATTMLGPARRGGPRAVLRVVRVGKEWATWAKRLRRERKREPEGGGEGLGQQAEKGEREGGRKELPFFFFLEFLQTIFQKNFESF